MSQQWAKESIDRLKSAGIVSLSPSGNYTRAEMAENIIANCNQDRQDGASKDTSLNDSHVLQEIKEVKLEIISLREEMQRNQKQSLDIIKQLQNENKKLHDDMNRVMTCVAGQQRFLKHLDYKERANNLIILGLSEKNNFENAKSDKEKIDYIFEKIDVPGIPLQYTSKLLGVKSDGNKVRPLLVELQNGNIRKEVLKKFTDARNIQQIKDVRLKKDQHPAIRAEWWRMFMAEKKERDKPENVGSNIVFDKKKRILL